MLSLPNDLRYALRALRNAPGFVVVAALTLGLGIGANAAMVGLFDALLVRPPAGVSDPGRVVRVEVERPGAPGRPPMLDDILSRTQFAAVRTRARGFQGVTAFATAPLGVGEGDAVRNEQVILASGDYFAVLGVRAARGRVLHPGDDQEGAAAPVAVLSWDYWQRAYGGDAAVLGRVVRVAGQSLTIVGVAPERFTGTALGSPALWVPLSLSGALGYDEQMMRSPHVSWLTAVGRLAPGVTPEQARATAQAALLAAEDERLAAPPPSLRRGGAPGNVRVEMRMRGPGLAAPEAPPPPRVRLAGLGGAGQREGPGDGSPVQLWYLAVTAAVLLIACANVANLLLARGASREHEMAVRLSLGATPRRIAGLLLTEGALLALLGGVAGLGVARAVWWLLPAVIPLPPLPPPLDLRALAITALLTLATVLLFGLAPLLGAWRADIRGLLGAAAPSLARKFRGRSALVVVQFAVAVVLLVGAGLFVRSFQKVRQLDLGFDHEHLLVVTAETRRAGWTPERAREFWERARERVRAIPGVREAALGASIPYAMRIEVPFAAETERAADPNQMEPTQLDYVDPAFFQTLGIRIRQGRPFTAEDRDGSPPVAVVSRSFAREHFGSVPPLGRCLRIPGGGKCIQVVGVADDARFGELTDATPSFVYQPLEQRPPMAPSAGVLHVRTEGDPAQLDAALRRELRTLDSTLPSVEVRAITELVAPQLAPWRASALLLAVSGAIGLLLAAVGLYGVVAFLVARRTRELGIRMALGAGRGRILALVLSDAGRLAGAGAALGFLLAAAASRFMASLLYGVGTFDPLVYGGASALLLGVALLAALSPARRATRVDPCTALRME